MKVKEFIDSLNETLITRFQNPVLDRNGPYSDEYNVVHSLIEPTLKKVLAGVELPFTWHITKNNKYTFQFNFSEVKDPCQLICRNVYHSCLFLNFQRKKHISGKGFYPCHVEMEFQGATRNEMPSEVNEMELQDILILAYEDMFAIHMADYAKKLIRFTNALSYLDAHGITDIDEFIQQTQSLLTGSSFLSLKQHISVAPSWGSMSADGVSVPFALLPEAIKRLYTFIEDYFKKHPKPIFGGEQMRELLEGKNKARHLRESLPKTVYIGISSPTQVEFIKMCMDKLIDSGVKYPKPDTDDDLYMECRMLQMPYSGTMKLAGYNLKDVTTCEALRATVKGPGVWYAYDRVVPPVLMYGEFDDASKIPDQKNAIVIVLYGDQIS